MTEDLFKQKEQLATRIEIAKPGDEQFCRDLRVEALTGPDSDMFNITPEEFAEESDLKWWEAQLSTNDDIKNKRFFILGWHGSEAIGIGRIKKTIEEGVFTMGGFYVKPKFRGTISPRAAFNDILNEIQRRGGSKVEIGVNVKNERMILLYEKLGFKSVGIIEWAGKTWNEMELDLTK